MTKTWLGGLGLNFLGGGWGEGCSVQWVGSKLVAASCHCCRLPFVNVSSDLGMMTVMMMMMTMMMIVMTMMLTWLKRGCCHC